jgi:ubiquinone/menaquinone biosynthesis C-methylase UbiE
MDQLADIEGALGRPSLRILDVGPGGYQPWLDELVYRGHAVTAIDVDAAAVEMARERLGARAVILQADGKTFDTSGFDVVTCISTIEHDPGWRVLTANLAQAPRVLLTFGVVAPERDTATFGRLLGQTMFLGTRDVPEVLEIATMAGTWPVGSMVLEPVGDLMAYGGALLTFVVRLAREGVV